MAGLSTCSKPVVLSRLPSRMPREVRCNFLWPTSGLNAPGTRPWLVEWSTPNVQQEWMALHGTSTKHNNELESLEVMFTMLVSLTIVYLVYHSPARSCYSFMVRGVIVVTTQRQVYGLLANWDEPASRTKQTLEARSASENTGRVTLEECSPEFVWFLKGCSQHSWNEWVAWWHHPLRAMLDVGCLTLLKRIQPFNHRLSVQTVHRESQGYVCRK